MLRLVPTPIGNIGDITHRASEALMSADILLCEDTRVTKKLLLLLQERYNLTPKADQEFYSLHSHNEKEFVEKLTPDFFDKEVVYVSDAGMPSVSDPASLLVQYAQKRSITYDVLAGANAALVAYVASGFSQTQMLFWGFLPHKGSARSESLNGALYSGFVTVLYESVHRIQKLLGELEILDPSREIFVAKELTKLHQAYYKGTPSEVRSTLPQNPKGEWVVVLSPSEVSTSGAISQSDIMGLDLPKKTKAKLLAKVTKRGIKECYEELMK